MFWPFFITLMITTFLVVFLFAFTVTGLAVLLGFTGVVLNRTAGTTRQEVSALNARLLAVFQFYFWAGWSAFCAVLTHKYTAHAQITAGWFYWIVAFGFCIAPLGFLVRKESASDIPEDRANALRRGSLYSAWVVITLFIFACWPGFAAVPYGWFLHYIH